jgi:quercetin dioxygenase-like cupin family protein
VAANNNSSDLNCHWVCGQNIQDFGNGVNAHSRSPLPGANYRMSFLDLKQLPFIGMSYNFVGENHDAPFSAYIVNAPPGKGPPLHTHPYVEVGFIIEGTARFTIGSETREAKAGSVVVIPANAPHRFVNVGENILRSIDIHASPKFVQTNL